MNSDQRVVIIGAGQAGGTVAKTLRKEGFMGPIDIIGDETHLPYERPALSKGVLTGRLKDDSTYLFTEADATALNTSFHVGVEALKIDRDTRHVFCSEGLRIPYDLLVIATGSRVRKLDTISAEPPDIYYLRTLNDAKSIRRRLVPGSSLLVIGGGWIGLEVAASAKSLGLDVTIIEAGERLCARALPTEVSSYLHDLHEKNDVNIQVGVTIDNLASAINDQTQVTITDQSKVFDTVVAGIGVLPNSELASASGLHVDNGIVTDAEGRTGDPSVFSCGDVTCHFNSFLNRSVRLESWANAQNQSVATARTILGIDTKYADIPWFWSDQYKTTIQILGLYHDSLQVVVRGERESGSFTFFYLGGGKIQCAISINSPRDIAVARRLMEKGINVDISELGNTNVKLQSLLKNSSP